MLLSCKMTKRTKPNEKTNPYFDPILYGDETVKELQLLVAEYHNDTEGKEENDYDEKKEYSRNNTALGAHGNFNQVSKSLPIEYLIETRHVFGPMYRRKIHRNDVNQGLHSSDFIWQDHPQISTKNDAASVETHDDTTNNLAMSSFNDTLGDSILFIDQLDHTSPLQNKVKCFDASTQNHDNENDEEGVIDDSSDHSNDPKMHGLQSSFDFSEHIQQDGKSVREQLCDRLVPDESNKLNINATLSKNVKQDLYSQEKQNDHIDRLQKAALASFRNVLNSHNSNKMNQIHFNTSQQNHESNNIEQSQQQSTEKSTIRRNYKFNLKLQSNFELRYKILSTNRKINKSIQRIKHKIKRKSFDSNIINSKNNGCLHNTNNMDDATTILFQAIDEGNIQIVKAALRQGANVEEKNSLYGKTAFQTVFTRLCLMDSGVENQNFIQEYREILDILYAHGSDINKLDDPNRCRGWAPIHYAATFGNSNKILWLVKIRANVNVLTANTSESPIMMLAQRGDFSSVYHLVANKAHVYPQQDGCGRTLLHHAAMSGNKILLQFLVQCGCVYDKHKKDTSGETPISLCYRYRDCLEFLQKATL